jgi:FHA domain
LLNFDQSAGTSYMLVSTKVPPAERAVCALAGGLFETNPFAGVHPMLLVERQPKTSATEVDAVQRFRLRIRNDGTNEQLVDLTHGKTTIGSSPRCLVRIQQPGVHPLHCLILQEGDSLSVRRWAAGTRLNGNPFDEAPLAPGDRLSVGVAELVIEGPPNSNAVQDEPQPYCVVEQLPAEPCSEPNDQQPAESWADWNTARATEERQNTAFYRSEVVESVEAGHQAGWPAQWEQRREEAGCSDDPTAEVTERLLRVEGELASWKDARAEWQHAHAEWRAGRDEIQRNWIEVERRLDELQCRVSDVAGRIGRLEQSAAATQATTSIFLSPGVTDQLSQTPAARAGVIGCATETPSPLAASMKREVNFAHQSSRETEEELAPFADFSIWSQGAASAAPTNGESTAAGFPPQPADVSAAQSAPEPVFRPEPNDLQNAPAKSFIERYAHMFGEEGSENHDASVALPASPVGGVPSESDELIRKPRNMGIVRRDGEAPPVSTDEEESIEQYMSKLLQRVRGDKMPERASQAPPEDPAVLASNASQDVRPGTAFSAATFAVPSQPSFVTSELPNGAEKGDWLTTSLGTLRRKAQMVEQPADLETLRALANETARRAISTHGLRTHRRNAVTKVIVSTLAGMTSLWLMLEAPHWRDLQFISACVSLIVAAYWAGQTYGELIETLRAAAYDGPEDQLEGFADPFHTDLPIDVVN